MWKLEMGRISYRKTDAESEYAVFGTRFRSGKNAAVHKVLKTAPKYRRFFRVPRYSIFAPGCIVPYNIKDIV